MLYLQQISKGVLYKGQISRKGVKGVTMKRKIYQQLLDWKEKRNFSHCLRRNQKQRPTPKRKSL